MQPYATICILSFCQVYLKSKEETPKRKGRHEVCDLKLSE
jgi:hypothetical protein